MAERDPVELYIEGLERIDKGVESLAQLKALSGALYQQMTLDIKVSDLAKTNPNATLGDVIESVYKNVGETYRKMEEIVERTEDTNLKAYMQASLDSIKHLVRDYLTPIVSILQTIILLKMIEPQRTLENYRRKLEETRNMLNVVR